MFPAALRERLGLNDSLPTQYIRFVVNAVEGDFGVSYRNGQKVLPLIAERFPATLELVFVATLISLLLGIPLGVLVIQDIYAIFVLAFQPNFANPSFGPVAKALVWTVVLLIAGFAFSKYVLRWVFSSIAKAPVPQ